MPWLGGKKKSDFPIPADFYLASAAECEKEAERMERIGDHAAVRYFNERAAMDLERALKLSE